MITYQSPPGARNHLCWWTRVGSSGPRTWLRESAKAIICGKGAKSTKNCNWEQVKVIQTEPARATLPLLCESRSTPVIPKVWHQPSAAPPTAFLPSKYWTFVAVQLPDRFGSACQINPGSCASRWGYMLWLAGLPCVLRKCRYVLTWDKRSGGIRKLYFFHHLF